jgi:transposase
MKRVHQLTGQECKDLEDGYKKGKKHHFRMRCHIILLSNNDIPVAEIARRLGKDKDTIYSMIERYRSQGIKGLENKRGQGRRAPLDSLTKKQAKDLKRAVDDEPQNLNKVASGLSADFGFEVTKLMLIRYLKKN